METNRSLSMSCSTNPTRSICETLENHTTLRPGIARHNSISGNRARLRGIWSDDFLTTHQDKRKKRLERSRNNRSSSVNFGIKRLMTTLGAHRSLAENED